VDPETLRPHLSRIHSVDVDTDAQDLRGLFYVLQADTRSIKNLDILSRGDHVDLDHDFPSLRGLSLNNASARWDSYSNLTTLNLACANERINFTQLRNLLLRSPELQELRISYPSGTDIVGLPESEGIIHLPYLRHMVLSTNPETIHRLLIQLRSVPASAHITLHSSLPPVLSFLPVGVSHLSPLQITPTTVLRLKIGSEIHLLSGSARPWSKDKSTIQCFIPFYQRSLDEHTEAILATIPTRFDVSLLTTLELLGFRISNELAAFQNFLFSMPHLRTFRVDYSQASFSVTALGSIPDNESSVPCPLLTRMEIGSPGMSPFWMKVRFANVAIPSIIASLRNRFTSLGHPLHTLEVLADLNALRVELLKPYVKELLITIPSVNGEYDA
jgi:hypothetical protein